MHFRAQVSCLRSKCGMHTAFLSWCAWQLQIDSAEFTERRVQLEESVQSLAAKLATCNAVPLFCCSAACVCIDDRSPIRSLNNSQELEVAADEAMQSENKVSALNMLLSESNEQTNRLAAELQVDHRLPLLSNCSIRKLHTCTCMHCGAAAEILLTSALGSGPVPTELLSAMAWQVVNARQSDAEAELLRASTEAMQAQLERADLKARSLRWSEYTCCRNRIASLLAGRPKPCDLNPAIYVLVSS